MFLPNSHRRGLSYIEVIVSIPLVAMVLVTALNTTGGVARTWHTIQDKNRGPALAEQLMAEILQQHYEDPDGSPVFGRESESGGNRVEWDDIDDYAGWSQSPPENKNGATLSGVTGWTRAASVEYVQRADPSATSMADQGVKRITVTVTDPAGKTTVLVAHRSRWGALEQLTLLDATVQGYVSHQMGIGTDTLHGGASLPNHVEDQ